MNGLLFLASIVIIGVIAWVLVEKFAPGKLAGFKTIMQNLIMGIPVIGPELANQLLGFDFGRFVSADHLPYYVGALIMLNIFGRFRTNTAVGEPSPGRDIDWDVR